MLYRQFSCWLNQCSRFSVILSPLSLCHTLDLYRVTHTCSALKRLSIEFQPICLVLAESKPTLLASMCVWHFRNQGRLGNRKKSKQRIWLVSRTKSFLVKRGHFAPPTNQQPTKPVFGSIPRKPFLIDTSHSHSRPTNCCC